MSKRVMIDGRNLSLDKGTGVATYARNLSHCLHELGYMVDILYGNRSAPGQSNLMREIAFYDTNAGDVPRWLRMLRGAKESLLVPLGYEAVEVPITGAVIADTFQNKMPYYDSIYNSPDLFKKASNNFGVFGRFHKVHLSSRPDLMHWTYPLPLRIPGIPNIYTLHDLVPLRLPYTTLDNKRKYFKLVSKVAKSADHIITVSETSKRDIMGLLGVDESKITNTYQSVSIPKKYIYKPVDDVAREVEGTFGVPYKEYYLFCGSIEPKKNIGRIIEAYLSSKVNAPLVIVGAQAWKSEDELKLLYDDNIRTLIFSGNEARVNRKVIQLSYAPFPLLISLIRGAKSMLFPSLYEGFGLPVLEAMLLGTPVITSNTSSLPEIAGDAAMLVNPYDANEITNAIRWMDSDADMRDELAKRGVERAKKFSRNAYKESLSIYSKFL